jgi:hypothetical protein
MRRILSLLLPLTLVVVLIGGCSNSTDEADTEAPVISLQKPEAGNTVGVSMVTLVANATDNIDVTKVEFYVDGQLKSSVIAPPYQDSVALSSYTDGPHTAMAKAFDEAGNVASSATVTFIKGVRSVDVVRRMILAEITTSANCVSCAPQNEAFRTAIAGNSVYQERIITVKYHGWFPRPTDSIWLATQTWAKPRIDYLFIGKTLSFPQAWIDGSNAGSNANGWIGKAQNDLSVAPEARIELTKTGGAGAVTLNIKVTGMNATAYSDLHLHTVVTEDDIYYNDGNAEFEHYDVMCEMLPDADGEAITLTNGQSQTFSRNITVKQGWHLDKLNAVVFVQSKGSKAVLQAAKISLK